MKHKKILAMLLSLPIMGASMPVVYAAYDYADTMSAYRVNGVTYSVIDGEAVVTGCEQELEGEVVIQPEVSGLTVTRIDADAFYDCDKITSVVIPDTVSCISERAFWYCRGLEKVDLGKGVKRLGGDAFSECTALQEVDIPDSVTELEEGCFLGCKHLKKATLGKGITMIANSLFYDCRELTEVVIKGRVESISAAAFERTGLTKFDIPDGVSVIEDNTFKKTQLTEITIPDSVTSIGESAFEMCLGLKEVRFGQNVQEINDNAFRLCTALEQAEIPDSVSYIGKEAFSRCENIKDMVIPEKVSHIGMAAFYMCSGMNSIKVLNPECDIQNDETKLKSFKNNPGTLGDPAVTVVYCQKDSPADMLARKYDYAFVYRGGPGDINDDGFIDSSDASEILRSYTDLSVDMDKEQSREYYRFDVNKDGYTDSVDASNVLAYYAYVSVGNDTENVDITTYLANK